MAVELYETASFSSRGVERTLNGETVVGSAIFWIYDPVDSSVNNNGLWVGLLSKYADFRSWNLGVSGGESYHTNYWLDVAGVNVETAIARTEGWHEFRFEIGTEIDVSARLYIDNILVTNVEYSTGNVEFDTARIMAPSPGTRAGSEFYVDDFTYTIFDSIALTTNNIPYEETFESYSSGFEIHSVRGWSASDSSNAVVSAGTPSVIALNGYNEPCGYPVGAADHDKVLKLSGTVTNSFSVSASQMVWLDMMVQAGSPGLVDAGLLDSAHMATYFNNDGHPVVYHYDNGGSSNRWTEIPEITKSGWARATICLSYDTGYFQIKIDGNPLTNIQGNTSNDGFGSAGGSWFAMSASASQLNQVVLDGHDADIDDLVLTTVNPFSAAIASFEYYSGNVYRMVLDFPEGNQMASSVSYPLKSTDLTSAPWATVAHSTNGVSPWLITNLNYSATEGESQVIYLQSTEDAAFFGLGEL